MLVPAATGRSAAPAPDERPIYARQPYDEIRLNEANRHAVLQVEPLELPGRQLPTVRSGSLRTRLIDRPGSEYQIAWTDIDTVTLYPQLVLQEAQRLTKEGLFDNAYRGFKRLLDSYPQTLGLEAAVEDFLLQNGAASYRARNYTDSLDLLLELCRRNPQRTDVDSRVDTIADKLISNHVAESNFVAARGLLETVAQQLPGKPLPQATAWRARLVDQATTFRDRARQRIAAGAHNEALEDCRRALDIWPSLSGVAELAAKIGRDYPHLTVGVMLAAPQSSHNRLDDWADHRAARLVRRTVTELSGYDAEGSRYTSPFGTIELGDTGREFDITLRRDVRLPGRRPTLTGYTVSQQLLAMADPNRGPVQAVWSELLGGVTVEDVFRVRMLLTRRHVRPEALLVVPPVRVAGDQETGNPVATGPYVIAQRSEDRVRYVLGDASIGTPLSHLRQITERHFTDAQAAHHALRRGTIDVIDRVAPWDVAALQRGDGIRIGGYALPTVHVLIANPKRPLTATLALRRAVCYGIHRQAILDRVILGGQPRAGFELLSGPFPRGLSLDDPIGAAADRQVDPYPYEPRLALILAMVASREVAAARAKVNRQEGNRAREATPDPQRQGTAQPAESQQAETTASHPGATAAANSATARAAPPAGSADEPLTSSTDRDPEDASAGGGGSAASADDAPAATRTLVLAFRPAPLARIVCEAIQAHLKLVGIPVHLKALAPEELDRPLDHADLLYAELALWEPVVDAFRLLGEGGLVGATSPYMDLALDDLAQAQSWKQVRDQLRAVDRIAHDELTVIPLWQTYNSFAYRTSLRGVLPRPVTLYQGVQQWRRDDAVK